MSNLRQEFEGLPEIKKRLISVKFNDALNHDGLKNSVLIKCLEVAQYLNGAWCIYQQQHNRIALLERRIDLASRVCQTNLTWRGRWKHYLSKLLKSISLR